MYLKSTCLWLCFFFFKYIYYLLPRFHIYLMLFNIYWQYILESNYIFYEYKQILWKIVHCAIFKWHLFILEKIISHILIKTFCIYHAFQVFRNRLLFKYLFKKKQQNVQNSFFNCKEAFSNSIVNKHNILRVNKWCQLKWVNKKTKKKFH